MNGLLVRIQSRKATLGIIGLGYVGLPLAVNFALKKFRVFGFDIDNLRVQKIVRGNYPATDLEKRLVGKVIKNRTLKIGSKAQILKGADVFIICVPTPLSVARLPDFSFVQSAGHIVAKYLRKNSLVILESTMYPGATEEFLKPILERSRLKAGKDFCLSCVPERVDPGNKDYPPEKIPVVIGGIDVVSTKLASALFQFITPETVEVPSAKVAELSKLLENSFRLVNISFINQFAEFVRKEGVDISEVIEAARTKPFGFMSFFPGPGAGGHCIPVDPVYLEWRARQKGEPIDLLERAINYNWHRPILLASKIAKSKALENSGKKVLLLGVSYKKESADIREAPGPKIISNLLNLGIKASYFDPYVPEVNLGNGQRLKSKTLKNILSSKWDLIVCITNHEYFKSPQFKSILKSNKIIDVASL